MRYLILLILLLFPLSAFAGWSTWESASSGYISYLQDQITARINSSHQYADKPYRIISTGGGWYASQVCATNCTTSDLESPGLYLYNVTYTEDQCTSVYGPGYVPDNDLLSGQACTIPDPSDYDTECEAIKPDYVTLPVDPGLGFSWDSGGCRFTTSDVVPCLETPSGEYSCNVTSAVALQVEPPLDEEPLPTDGKDASSDYTETTDPATDCPFSNVSWGGVSYCYSGDDAPVGADYADGSTRVDHWDGSYTVTDSQGTSVIYNADGTPSGTASNLPGAGPAGDGYCPDWWCDGDGSGLGSSEDPAVPQEVISVQDHEVLYDSGMAETATCPPPEEVTFSLGGQSMSIGFAYDGFCTLAGYLRPLLLAMANLAAAMLIYRGIL